MEIIMKPTWKRAAHNTQAYHTRITNIDTQPLTTTQRLFRDTLIENLPPGTGINATINQHITYIIIPTETTKKCRRLVDDNHEPPQLNPLLAIIYWTKPHIEIHLDSSIPFAPTTKINRADPNWLEQLLTIINNALKTYQQTSS